MVSVAWRWLGQAGIKTALAGLLLMVCAVPVLAGNIDIAKTSLYLPSTLIHNPQISLYNAVTLAGSRLVAVGEAGRIILSDDSGKTWRQVEVPTSVTLTNVRFNSPNLGWAVGNMGVVLRTTDAGLTWKMQFNGVEANQEILSAAQDADSAGAKDAAAQANLQLARELVGGGPTIPFLYVLPLTAQDLMIVGGYGMAFTSGDGGQSFQSIFNQIPNPNGLHIYAIIQDGAQLILAGEQGMLLRRDAAGNFTTLNSPAQGTFFGGLRSAAGTLMVYGLQGEIMRSSDHGNSWQQITSPSTASIDCGIVLKNGDILLGDEVGNLLLSHDDGKSFSMIVIGEPVIALVQSADGTIVTASMAQVGRLDPHFLEPRS